jgi:CG-1 domain
MRLKFDGQDFAICAYTKGNGMTDNFGNETPESFKRRAYWLKDNPRFIFVHYLDEANKYYL